MMRLPGRAKPPLLLRKMLHSAMLLFPALPQQQLLLLFLPMPLLLLSPRSAGLSGP
jgi:hypothetical protein